MKRITLFILTTSFLVISLHAQKVEILANSPNPLRIESTSGTQNWVEFYNTNGYQGYYGLFSGASDMDFGTGLNNETGKVHLVTNATPKLTVIPNGNVGIGVTDPDASLEVNGQLKITGGSPGVNKVLVSDADGLATWSESPPPPVTTYAVGDFAQGGVVFWVSANGQHGKVVSIYNFGKFPWSNISDTSVGESAQSITNGGGNTVAVIMQTGHIHSASRLCADFAYGGYDDWYLPSEEELTDLWLNRSVIEATANANGGEDFAHESFWSSTEVNSTTAKAKNFLGGGLFHVNKLVNNNLRPIRAF